MKRIDTSPRRALRALSGVLADILLAGVFLLVFAYFQHGRAFLNGELAVDMSSAIPVAAVASSPFPDKTVTHTPAHADKFTSGEAVITESTYQSPNVSVSWARHEEGTGTAKVVYYVADIYVRTADYICTAVPEHGYDTVQKLAAANGAILAINGDYAPAREQGVIVRDGMLIRDTGGDADVLALYDDGDMRTFAADEFDVAAEGARGLRGAWSFGPALLDADGRAKTDFVTTVAEANPRTAVGCYEPGHYCFVAVDGRGMEGSAGMTMAELAALFESLGCKTAYNLDGGQSSVMAWDEGRVTVNAPANGGRPVSDIIYIPKE